VVSGKSRAEPSLSVSLGGGGGARAWFLVASDGRKRRGANRIEVEAATNNLEDEDEDEEKGPKESERAARRPARSRQAQETVDSIGPTRELCASSPCEVHNG